MFLYGIKRKMGNYYWFQT